MRTAIRGTFSKRLGNFVLLFASVVAAQYKSSYLTLLRLELSLFDFLP